MKRQGIVEEWYDRKIVPGAHWETEISANIDAADIVLLLVSSDFIASDYCYGIELRRALERCELGEAKIVPLILRPVSWQEAPFGHFQALPKDGKPVTTWINFDEAWLDITVGLRKVVEEIKAEKSSIREQEEPLAIGELVMQEVKRIEAIFGKKEPIGGLPTGFAELDSLIDGVHRSEVIVVAGRPLMGKTDFVLNVASNVALIKTAPVMIFSLRLTRERMISRLLASEAEVPLDRILRGTLTSSDWVALARASDDIFRAPILIQSGATIEVGVLEERVERANRTRGLGLVIVDGLEHVIASGKDANASTGVASIVKAVRLMARKHDIPLILTLTTSREADGRTNKRPRIRDLGEWEALASDVADVVVLLYQDEVYNPNSDLKGIAEIIVAKNQYGPTQSVELVYLTNRCAFRTLYRE